MKEIREQIISFLHKLISISFCNVTFVKCSLHSDHQIQLSVKYNCFQRNFQTRHDRRIFCVTRSFYFDDKFHDMTDIFPKNFHITDGPNILILSVPSVFYLFLTLPYAVGPWSVRVERSSLTSSFAQMPYWRPSAPILFSAWCLI